MFSMPITRRKLVPDRALAALFRDFEEHTELSEQGLSYTRHDFQELYEILPDAFSVAPSISRSEAVQLFRKALIRCRRAGPLTADAMIEHAGAIHRVALAVPRRKFTMWTKFRAQNMFHTPGFRLERAGVSIRKIGRAHA